MKLHLYLFLSIIHYSKASQDASRSNIDINKKKEYPNIKWAESEEDFFWRELGQNSYPSKY